MQINFATLVALIHALRRYSLTHDVTRTISLNARLQNRDEGGNDFPSELLTSERNEIADVAPPIEREGCRRGGCNH